jgi:hypothetical protein
MSVIFLLKEIITEEINIVTKAIMKVEAKCNYKR